MLKQAGNVFLHSGWCFWFDDELKPLGTEAERLVDMMNLVSRLKYGNTNTFFIRGTSGGLLVDTDYAGTLPLFYKELKKNAIRLSDITYVLATHYHPDHMGLVSELMQLGVKLLLLDTQVEYVHFSDEIFRREKRTEYMPIEENEAVLVKWEESRTFLHDVGIEGEIISTPSHSNDSVSLILDNGTCFVGDLEPINYLDAYEENEKLKEDWKLIMSY
ncbi:MAG: MBL fold metallo-hydrolase, partial [Lachnospiraceae bacterium]|nr:MBL fold metallo-hydrolase [Lachnospiraceae bacterium]